MDYKKKKAANIQNDYKALGKKIHKKDKLEKDYQFKSKDKI